MSNRASLNVVIVPVVGPVRREVWNPNETRTLTRLQQAVDGLVDVVAWGPGLDMWINDDGMFTQAVNPRVSIFGRQRYAVQDFYGDAVFTGGTDRHGNTKGLTEKQALLVVQTFEEIENA